MTDKMQKLAEDLRMLSAAHMTGYRTDIEEDIRDLERAYDNPDIFTGDAVLMMRETGTFLAHCFTESAQSNPTQHKYLFGTRTYASIAKHELKDVVSKEQSTPYRYFTISKAGKITKVLREEACAFLHTRLA